MTDASPMLSRDEAMLARLAELDLAAAEKAHAKLMAAEEAAEVAELGRTYQRMSRSLRQTLALKAKLAREWADEEVRAKLIARRDGVIRENAMERRVTDLQDAVARIAAADNPELPSRKLCEDLFDFELDDWYDEPDFLVGDLDAQVLRACRVLHLPEELAATWRKLPRPPPLPDGVEFPTFDELNADADDDDASPPVIHRDTG